ncbi:hypothetical protein BCR37DRAFT_390550 [Protomyces lactucae-debilis]|uniref:BZIP domain-containing protein n=1 Tax=Protomyces lactucae-debilis TaxID=2754530 RepID=A0A1Y2FS25_PROLT|nr:uncharacterized protein BCR37DRAFT_390550 [Protomyces lactucae-debilis]ORY86811.1 hypothetical protein BCR37DRAFT_390550 [Protomyces lactucae-debilis]
MSTRKKDEKRVNYAEPPSDVDDRELLEAQEGQAGEETSQHTVPSKRRQVSASASGSQDEEGGRPSSTPNKVLASGKRADQNRKAQRAFRQRKDRYIKDLELRSQELDIANSLIIQLKEENDRLNEIAKSFHARNEELEEQLARFARRGSGSSLGRGRDPSSVSSHAQQRDGAQSHASSSGDRGPETAGLAVPVPVPRYDAAAGGNGGGNGNGDAAARHGQVMADAYYSSARDSGGAGGTAGLVDAGQVYSQAKGLI